MQLQQAVPRARQHNKGRWAWSISRLTTALAGGEAVLLLTQQVQEPAGWMPAAPAASAASGNGGEICGSCDHVMWLLEVLPRPHAPAPGA